MKRLITIATVVLSLSMFTSCRWIHETFYSINECTEWYLEELYKAAKDDDEDKFEERSEQFEDWVDELKKSERKKVKKAIDRWGEKHERRMETINKFEREMNED